MLRLHFQKNLSKFSLNLNLEVPSGAVLGLFGPSGCGKSMTLRCIAGLESPNHGIIQVNGMTFFESSKKTNIPACQRKVGYLFQNYALFPHLTVEKNIAFGLEGFSASQKAQRVSTMMERLRLKGLEQRYPHQISGGQQQRVALARTLVTDPGVLLLDEPFSALDKQVKSKLEKEIFEVRNTFSGAMVLVTHDLEEAYRLCSHIALMEEGKILQLGTKDQIIRSPQCRTVARLTGAKNIFDGIIDAREGQRATLWIEELQIRLNVDNCFPQVEKLSVGIRPGDIRLLPYNHSVDNFDNIFPAKISQVIYGVDMLQIFLRFERGEQKNKDYDIQLLVPLALQEKENFQEGRLCMIQFPVDSLMLWPT